MKQILLIILLCSLACRAQRSPIDLPTKTSDLWKDTARKKIALSDLEMTYDTVKVLLLLCDTSNDNRLEYTPGYNVKVKWLYHLSSDSMKVTTSVWSYGYLVVAKFNDSRPVDQYPKFGFHTKNVTYLNGNKKRFKAGTVIFQSLYLRE